MLSSSSTSSADHGCTIHAMMCACFYLFLFLQLLKPVFTFRVYLDITRYDWSFALCVQDCLFSSGRHLMHGSIGFMIVFSTWPHNHNMVLEVHWRLLWLYFIPFGVSLYCIFLCRCFQFILTAHIARTWNVRTYFATSVFLHWVPCFT